MDQPTKDRLAAVLAKESKHRKAEADKQKRLAELDLKKKSDIEQVETKWRSVRSVLQSVVMEINETIKASKLVFVVEEKHKREGYISKTSVTLVPNIGNEERGVIFNVENDGWVVPVFILPTTGKAPDRFNLDKADQNFIAAMLVDFLDQSLAYEDHKRK